MIKTRMVNRPEVLKMLQVSRSNLYLKIERGLWPKPIQQGERGVAWLSHENNQMLTAIIAGKSDAEIISLVKTLEAQRKTEAFEYE